MNQNQDKTQPRVMFVDDSRLMRYAAGKFLTGRCEFVMAENGREAWQRINADPGIDMIFTDLMMPIMDGHELIRLIRTSASRHICELPVLVITSQEEAAARERAVSEGATDFISKPFSAEDLLYALHISRPHPDSGTSNIANLARGDAIYQGEGGSRLHEPGDYLHRLDQTLSFHQRQQLDLALLHLQFQGYRSIADRYGQSWADAVMRNLYRVLVELLRQEDSIHRTGADLLSVILMGTDREGARTLTNRLRHRLGGATMQFASMTVKLDLRFAVQFPDVQGEQDASELRDAALRLIYWRNDQQSVGQPAAALTGAL